MPCPPAPLAMPLITDVGRIQPSFARVAGLLGLLLWAGLQASEPGLLATFFDNQDLTGPSVSRVEPALDASWNSGSPDAAIGPDSFSARWMGILRPRTTGNHTLYVTTDDGVRAWIDGRLVVDAWVAKSASTLSAVVPLTAGMAHTVRIEYFEQAGSASARLEWSSATQAREIIPSSCLEAVAVGAASPSAITVAHASNGTLLSWSMLSNDVSGFAIERTDVSGSYAPVAAVSGNVRSWLDTSVPVAGAQQGYRIQAITSAGPSPWVVVNGSLPTGAEAVGFLATYWDNKDFTGTWLQRLDATVDFAWGSTSPAAPLGVDTFSVRWTGFITPPSTGLYTLFATSDDGVRVWVDGVSIIDAWKDRSVATSSGTVPLTAGQRHAIRMDFYENGYNATARLEWSGPGLSRSVIPASAVSGGLVLPLAPTHLVAATTSLVSAPICLTWQAVDADQTAFAIERAGSDGVFAAVATVAGTARHWDDAMAVAGEPSTYRIRAVNALGAGAWAQVDATLPPVVTTPGFLATYWDNRDWTGTRVMRIDPLIDFAWAAGSPSPHIAADTFAVRWTGSVVPSTSGTYTFHATSDDGVRVWVDERPVIDIWVNRSAATSTGTAVLTAGAVHQVRMEFYENAGNATARLEWSGPGVTRQLVPACQLVSSVAPVITAAASASPSPVTGATTTVSVTANDDGPLSALTYTWSASGPAPVSFSPNGGPSAQNAQATFCSAGSYLLTVTVRDAGGLTATSTVPVLVVSTPTSIVVAPAEAEIPAGTSQTFSTALHDQFGAVFAAPGAATWTVSGGGTIAATSATTGSFTAAACGGIGQHTVTATVAGISGTATVVVSTTGAVPSIRPPFTASGTVGVPFSYTIKACNGPTAFAATNLPPGLSVDAATGNISGIPQVAGTTTVTLLASNANGTGTASLSCAIAIGTPIITWADPAPITTGTLLGASQLNATAPLPGSFAYTPAAGADLPAGTHQLSVTFTPDDAANYQPTTAYATLVVQAQVPVITWPIPAAITYGNALTTVQLNATTTIPGTWAYQPELGIMLEAGTHPLTVVFTPADPSRYAPAAAEVSLAVQQRIPTIVWPSPATIAAGTVLSATQLNATASLPGSFVYDPAPGTILAAGTHLLSVVFVPADPHNHAAGTASVSLTVQAPDEGSEPPSIPVMALTIAGGLTGVEHGVLDGIPVSFTKATELTVQVTAVSTGTISTVTVSGGSSGDVTGAPGATLTIPVASEGRVSLTASATASLNGQTVAGSSNAVVVMVDRTPPRLQLFDPGMEAPLPVGLVTAGGRALVLTGASDAPMLREALGWPCWQADGLTLPVRVSDESGLLADQTVVARVGPSDLEVEAGGLLNGSAADSILWLGGFASLPEALGAVDSTTLATRMDAGLRPLHVQVEDQCGNIATAALCSVWKQGTPTGQLRIGYIPFTRSGFPGSVGVLPQDGTLHGDSVTLVAASADIVMIEQNGKAAERLSPDLPDWTAMAGADAVLWRLPSRIVAATDDTISLTLSARDAAGNLLPGAVLRAHVERLVPPHPTPAASVVSDTVTFDSINYVSGTPYIDYSGTHPGDIPEIGDGYGGFLDEAWVSNAFYSAWIICDVMWLNDDDAVGYRDIAPIGGLAYDPVQTLLDGDGLRLDSTVPVPADQRVWRFAAPREATGRYKGDAIHLGIQAFPYYESRQDEYDVTGHVTLSMGEVQPYYRTWSGWWVEPGSQTRQEYQYLDAYLYPDPVTIREQVTRYDDSLLSSWYVWHALLAGTPEQIVNMPPSWRSTPFAWDARWKAAAGVATWSIGGFAPTSLAPGSDGALVVPVPLDAPPGHVRIQWERTADAVAKRPLGQQHAGFQSLNVLRLSPDTLMAGSSAQIVIDGAFLEGRLPSDPGLLTPPGSTVSVVSSSRRQAHAAALMGLAKADYLANASVYRSWVDGMADELESQTATTRSLLLAERELRLGMQAAAQNAAATAMANTLSQLADLAPAQGLVGLQLSDGLAELIALAESTAHAADLALQGVGAVPQAQISIALATQAWQTRLTAARAQCNLQVHVSQAWTAYAEAVRVHLLPFEAELGLYKAQVADLQTPFKDVEQAWLELIATARDGQYHGEEMGFMENIFANDSDKQTFLATWNALMVQIYGLYDDPTYGELIAAKQFLAAHDQDIAGLLCDDSILVADAAADRTNRGVEPAGDSLVAVQGLSLDAGTPMRGLSQRLQVELSIGAAATDLFDVLVRCGKVKAYPDELSQQYAGANGAHRMKEALLIQSIEVTDFDGNTLDSDAPINEPKNLHDMAKLPNAGDGLGFVQMFSVQISSEVTDGVPGYYNVTVHPLINNTDDITVIVTQDPTQPSLYLDADGQVGMVFQRITELSDDVQDTIFCSVVVPSIVQISQQFSLIETDIASGVFESGIINAGNTSETVIDGGVRVILTGPKADRSARIKNSQVRFRVGGEAPPLETSNQRVLSLMLRSSDGSTKSESLMFTKQSDGKWLSEAVILARAESSASVDPFLSEATGSLPRIISVRGGEGYSIVGENKTWKRDTAHIEKGIDTFLWGNLIVYNEETVMQLMAIDGNWYRPGRYDRTKLDFGLEQARYEWSIIDSDTATLEQALYVPGGGHKTTNVGNPALFKRWGPWDFNDKSTVDKLTIENLVKYGMKRESRNHMALISHGSRGDAVDSGKVFGYTPRNGTQVSFLPDNFFKAGKPIMNPDKLLVLSCYGNKFVDGLRGTEWTTPIVTVNNDKVRWMYRPILRFADGVQVSDQIRIGRRYASMLSGVTWHVAFSSVWNDNNPAETEVATLTFTDKGAIDAKPISVNLTRNNSDARVFEGSWNDGSGNTLPIQLRINGKFGNYTDVLKIQLTFPGLGVDAPWEFPALYADGAWTSAIQVGEIFQPAAAHPALDGGDILRFYNIWASAFGVDSGSLLNAYWDFYLTPSVIIGDTYRWPNDEGSDGHWRYWPGLDSIRLSESASFKGEYYLEPFNESATP